jgi:urease alpha subunit
LSGIVELAIDRICLVLSCIVDPETYEVKADGVLCDAPPATSVTLGKKHFVF